MRYSDIEKCSNSIIINNVFILITYYFTYYLYYYYLYLFIFFLRETYHYTGWENRSMFH